MGALRTEGRLAIIEGKDRPELLIAGDIHGDLSNFQHIEELFLRKPESILILLGDYADRGSRGLEVVEGLGELMRDNQGRVIALKGNHEDYREGTPKFHPCTLISEVEGKRRIPWSDFYPEFEEFLDSLFLAAVVPGFFLMLHGGISRDITTMSDLKDPPRALEKDILWSDPSGSEGQGPNPRGAGVLFGPDISEQVLKEIDVNALIRGHQPRKAREGPSVDHSGRVVTVSSTSVYGGRPFVLDIDLDKYGGSWLQNSVWYLDRG